MLCVADCLMHQTANLVHLENVPKPPQAASVEPPVEMAASRSAGEEDEQLYDEEEDEYYEEEDDDEDDEYDGFDNDFAVTGTTIETHTMIKQCPVFFVLFFMLAGTKLVKKAPVVS